MTLQMVTAAIQLATIVMLGGIIWTSQQTIKNSRKTAKMIESYRHDIAWLTARLGQLEMELETKLAEVEAKLRKAEM